MSNVEENISDSGAYAAGKFSSGAARFFFLPFIINFATAIKMKPVPQPTRIPETVLCITIPPITPRQRQPMKIKLGMLLKSLGYVCMMIVLRFTKVRTDCN